MYEMLKHVALLFPAYGIELFVSSGVRRVSLQSTSQDSRVFAEHASTRLQSSLLREACKWLRDFDTPFSTVRPSVHYEIESCQLRKPQMKLCHHRVLHSKRDKGRGVAGNCSTEHALRKINIATLSQSTFCSDGAYVADSWAWRVLGALGACWTSCSCRSVCRYCQSVLIILKGEAPKPVQ